MPTPAPTDALEHRSPPRDPSRTGLRASQGHLCAVADSTTAPLTSALEFSDTVRRVVELARRGGLSAPVFRSPPRLDGVDRTIRRGRRAPVVAIRRAGRPLPAVRADVIEGVVAANGLTGPRADRFRRAAWDCLEGSSPSSSPPSSSPAPRALAPASAPATPSHTHHDGTRRVA